MVYRLQGPLPAGAYTFYVLGFQQANDAVVHVDVIHRHGGVDDPIASGDGNSTLDPNSNLPGYVQIALAGPAANAACGDLLVTQSKMVSGSTDYQEYETALDIP